MNILVADDDPSMIALLTNALEAFGYDVTVANDGNEAFHLLRTGKYRLFISDWQMPGMTGLELCREIRRRGAGGYIYIILLTSFSGLDGVVQGLDAGADDFIAKPFNPSELLVRIRAGQRILNLESRELTIFALAKLAESRDQETGDHLERMREYVKILAEELSQYDDFWGIIDGDYINLLYLTSPLHDIGKVAIPDSILLKPGRLTAEEFEVMKTHTTLGARTLADVAECHPNASYLQMAMDIALTHHERWDGGGYPHGLKGTEIPLCGRITAIADVYDALTSNRVYKEAYSHEVAREIIERDRGTHFDPQLVDAFLHAEEKFLEIKNQMRSSLHLSIP
ncbi:HD domain-containing phosphohydrolase [Planctomicrobium piriforme]|uniref:Putative two-component system response regulator n=1 Tax=Planctomicrobium piriforme TaxID=1576369 RepID=A0A1I3H2D0_9PLAN|nr:HD domain-containing phosphohydrolase [Planctomicrobium piriforme]SFI29884.1 putative two-component system response regulator [Planctomicrobium piriforme]